MHSLKDRHCQSGVLKKGPVICCLRETHFKHKDSDDMLKLNGWRKAYHESTNQ